MAERIIKRLDGSEEKINLTRFPVPKGAKRVPWDFREVVKLRPRDFIVNKHGVAVYDEEPGVMSGMDDDGLLFSRFGRFMQVGIEHVFRYIHLFHMVKANSVVLDAACGYGELGKLLYTERKACIYVGMEVAGKKLIAASKLGWGSSKTMFVQRDLSRRLPFRKNTFDHVVSSEFIEHIPKKYAKRFLHDVRRVLKPGGTAIITTPNNQWGEVDPVHPNEYGYQETLDMVAGAGLEVQQTYGLKLHGNVRHWDKQIGGQPLYDAIRATYPSIWVKCMFATALPEESVFWSLVATKPEAEAE